MPRLAQLRAAVLAKFGADNPLTLSLPKYSPDIGSTPAPVNLSGIWEPTLGKARLVWSASADRKLSHYEVRQGSGAMYKTADEFAVASVKKTATELPTDAGLIAPGAVNSFKVYVVTTDGNERGSNTAKVSRPFMQRYNTDRRTATMLTNLPPPSKDLWVHAQRFTRADCERLEEVGFLDYRYELMEGVIIPQMGQLMPHGATVSEASDWLKGHFGRRYVVGQISINVAPEETIITRPEPDIILLNKPYTDIPVSGATPADIVLLAEVSYSTLDYDLTTKAGVYARAGIAQYFVIDVVGRVVYDHRLTAGGTYARETYNPGDSLSLIAAPHLALTVDEWLLP